MKLIVGLGNPGKKYARTRHNVGYMLIDKFLEKNLPKDVIVRKSNVFMNSSGIAVKKLTTHYQLLTTNLYIIHDDLDIKLGEYKIQKGRGPKDHKGVNSIEDSLGKTDFWRIRIGVENRKPDKEISGEEYVLQEFDDDELVIIKKVADKVIEDLELQVI